MNKIATSRDWVQLAGAAMQARDSLRMKVLPRLLALQKEADPSSHLAHELGGIHGEIWGVVDRLRMALKRGGGA